MTDTVQRLKTEIDLCGHLKERGVHFKGKYALCPFHPDHNSSLSVDKNSGVWLWHCHAGCGSGSIVDFEVKKTGCTVGEAIKRLAERYGFSEHRDSSEVHPIPASPAPDDSPASENIPATDSAPTPNRALFQEIITSLWSQSRRKFLAGEEKGAVEFLEKKGISFETAVRCNLAANTWTRNTYNKIRSACRREYGVDFKSFGLGGLYHCARYKIPFLIYPFWQNFTPPAPDISLDTVPLLHYIKFRPCLSRKDSDKLDIPPHIKPSGHKSSSLWIPTGLPDSEEFYIVEGETDCLTAIQAGVTAGALAGAGMRLPASLLSEIKRRNLKTYLIADADTAGETMLQERTRELLDAGIETIPLRLPKEVNGNSGWGKDLNDLWQILPESERPHILDLLEPVDCKSLVLSAAPAGMAGEDKPVITVTGSQLSEMIRISWAVLKEANSPPTLFIQGDKLAYLGISPKDANKPDKDRKPAIRHVSEAVMHGILIRHLDWVRMTERGPKPAKPPAEVARDMVNYRPLPDWLPPLDSIITAPSYGPDLKLIAPGYHPDLKLYHLPSVLISPPENPSEDEMAEAVEKIGHLLTDFPFKDKSDRTNAIGLLLLSLLRPAILGKCLWW